MIKTLIVEDDPMVAKINRLYLQQIPGIQITGICTDGNSALESVRKEEPDLIVLDQYMPGLTGLELLQILRQEHFGCDVIMITAANSRDQIMKAINLGVIDYLVKPFEFERFRQAVEKHIRKQQLLENKSELSQEEVDRLVQGNPLRPSSMNKTAGIPTNMEKGIQAETLHILLDQLAKRPEELFNCDQLSQLCSLSKVTVRRYMNYLIEIDKVESVVDYRTGGRPRLLYRLKKRQV